MKIFLTGEPRVGKTTMLIEAIRLADNVQGFSTQEIRAGTKRVGFKLIASTGQEGTLAHLNKHSNIRVSRYGVDLEELENFLVSLSPLKKDYITYLDEIGEMELHSDKFISLATNWLEYSDIFLGTITHVFQNEFVNSINNNSNYLILHITHDNRSKIKAILNTFVKNVDKYKILDNKEKAEVLNSAKWLLANQNYIGLKRLFSF